MAKNIKDGDGIGMPEIVPGQNKLPPGETRVPEQAKSRPEPESMSEKEQTDAKKREKEILALAIKRFKRCVEAETDNRKKALEDLKFKAGEQWDDRDLQKRKQEGRPAITINQIPTLTRQVSNDIRQNRPAINVSPLGDKTDKEAAEMYSGMINAIERDCQADIAYDTAITSAVDIGFGYWRILTEYAKEAGFEQVLVIRRIRNPFTVFLDDSRQEPDGADAKFGFITDMMDRSEFKEKWPKANQYPWQEKGVGDDYREWFTKDKIRIAEYFTMEYETKRLVQLDTGHVGFYDDLAPEIKEAITDGKTEIINERESECSRVVWHKITGVEILETNAWLGKWIPIVEVIGEEIDIQGKVTRSGIIRNAKEPARVKNYAITAKVEVLGMQPKNPFIGTLEQFEGYESDWDQANSRAFPRLMYNPHVVEGQMVPPPMRQPMAGVPEGFVQAEMGAQQDMLAATGIRFDQAAPSSSFDESGKALIEKRRNTDIGSFHFTDNASRSLRHTGRILIDLIPKYYDTKRIITILREDDNEERVTLDPTAGTPMSRNPAAKNPAERKIFNPSLGEYGVTVTIGPSYATKRIEASEQMLQFMRISPEKGQLIAHLFAKYSDWPGADEAYKILLKALPPELLTPDMKDMPPQIQQLMQAMNKKIAGLMAERQQMLKDLLDKKTDQSLHKLEIDKNFEAKMAKVVADWNKNMQKLDFDKVGQAIDMTDKVHQHIMRKDEVNLAREGQQQQGQVDQPEAPEINGGMQ
jgi:hypothetical protein